MCFLFPKNERSSQQKDNPSVLYVFIRLVFNYA